jgi:hypothetical protein
MLGDKEQSEKSKNPLKKAIRRRNAKTVTFSAPTYVEASEVEYSSDDDDGEGDYYGQDQTQQSSTQKAELEEDEITLVEASSTSADLRGAEAGDAEHARRESDDTTAKSNIEVIRTSDEIFDGRLEGSGKSRNGVVRNTDSFFKDDSVETRKISLTPNLLRDDSSTSTRTSNDSKEARQRPSFDKIEKEVAVEKGKDDKKKKDKKEKDKKPGMLSNLFKRKDKKGKGQDEDIDEIMYGKKASSEDSRSSPVPSKDSEDYMSEEQTVQRTSSPQRQPSKLQKQPRVEGGFIKQVSLGTETRSTSSLSRPPPSSSSNGSSMRIVQPEGLHSNESLQHQSTAALDLTRDPPATQNGPSDLSSALNASSTSRSRSTSDSEPRPDQLKQAASRSELDDSDSSATASPTDEQFKAPVRNAPQRPAIPGAFPDSYIATPASEKSDVMENRLSESPVQVSPVEASRSNPPALIVDTSSQEEAPSPSSSPSPDLIEVDEIDGKKSLDNSVNTPSSSSTWSDAHLRTFFDDDSDIKDLLIVVYDKSGVVPAGPDHPITGNMFREENAKLADITNVGSPE